MKIKKIAAVLLAGTMTLALAACGSSSSSGSSSDSSAGNRQSTTASTASAASDNDDTTFVVGFDAEYPPYGYMDEKTGEYTGFDLELAQEVCNRRGWTLEKKPINWDNKDAEVDSGSVDCLWNGMTYTGRENDYTWSEPYVDNSIMMVVAKDSDINSLDDLAGKTVITQSDSSALTALQGDGLKDLTSSFADLQQNPSYNTCFEDLKAGAVDAVAVDIGVARYQLSNNPDDFRMLDDPISTEQYAIAFKKGNTQLRDEVQETLNEMVDDGTFMKIAEEYADYNLPEMVCLGKDSASATSSTATAASTEPAK